MSMFKLTMETDNAAFEDRPEQEVRRILHELAKVVDDEGLDLKRGTEIKLRDVNGNTVGKAEFVP